MIIGISTSLLPKPLLAMKIMMIRDDKYGVIHLYGSYFKFAVFMEGPWNTVFYMNVWDIVNFLSKLKVRLGSLS